MPRPSRRTQAVTGSQSSRHASRDRDDVAARQRQRVQRTYGGRSQHEGGTAHNSRRDTRARQEEDEIESEGGEAEGGGEDNEDEGAAGGDVVEDDSEGEDGGHGLWGLSRKVEKLPVNEAMKRRAEQFEVAVSGCMITRVSALLTSRLQDVKRKANDLVRLALFCEQRRQPLKRDEIKERGR